MSLEGRFGVISCLDMMELSLLVTHDLSQLRERTLFN